jgi:hypothetical protein
MGTVPLQIYYRPLQTKFVGYSEQRHYPVSLHDILDSYFTLTSRSTKHSAISSTMTHFPPPLHLSNLPFQYPSLSPCSSSSLQSLGVSYFYTHPHTAHISTTACHPSAQSCKTCTSNPLRMRYLLPPADTAYVAQLVESRRLCAYKTGIRSGTCCYDRCCSICRASCNCEDVARRTCSSRSRNRACIRSRGGGRRGQAKEGCVGRSCKVCCCSRGIYFARQNCSLRTERQLVAPKTETIR